MNGGLNSNRGLKITSCQWPQRCLELLNLIKEKSMANTVISISEVSAHVERHGLHWACVWEEAAVKTSAEFHTSQFYASGRKLSVLHGQRERDAT